MRIRWLAVSSPHLVVAMWALAGSAALAKNCPGTSVLPPPPPKVQGAFEQCVCDIIGDRRASPPKKSCLVPKRVQNAIQDKKRAGCVTTMTKNEYKTMLSPALGETLARAKACDKRNTAVVNRASGCIHFKYQPSILHNAAKYGEWLKKGIIQEEAFHVYQWVVKKKEYMFDWDGSGDRSNPIGRLYRELSARTSSVELLDWELTNSKPQDPAEAKKLCNALAYLTKELKKGVEIACKNVLPGMSPGEFKTKLSKCKATAKRIVKAAELTMANEC